MAQYDPVLNLYVLDAADANPFLVPEPDGAASVIGDALDNTAWGNSSPNSLEGGEGNDLLHGFDGDDTLKGGYGTDYLYGGPGNDTYYVDDQTDLVLEPNDGGSDLVIASVSYAIQDVDIEDLLLTGTADINGSGNEGNNQITGNDGDNLLLGYGGSDTLNGGLGYDTLDGGLGADTLAGGQGGDTYYIDDGGDLVVEEASGGNDTIVTSIHANLQNYSHVEVLQAEDGWADLNLTGGNLNDTLLGNLGHNVLHGGGGADTMIGSSGNDTYYVDSISDSVVEDYDDGVDQVHTTVSYTLTKNVENLVAEGLGAIRLTGNHNPNKITGNAAANLIDGGESNDTLSGGGGNETYYVDDWHEKVVETSTGGVRDQIITTTGYAMPAYVENLTATGSHEKLLIGNTLSNIIRSSASDDFINSNRGNDTLYGGAGKDVFIFSTKLSKTSNLDRIVDYKVSDDTIYLDKDLFLKLTKSGPLSKSYFVTGPKAKDKNDYIVYDKAKGYLYYDADGSGSGAAVAFAKLATGLKMAASEFKVI